jgi:glycine C-acetyltransferase
MENALRYSLEDFWLGHAETVTEAPPDFDAWAESPETRACFAFFEQPFLAGPDARTEVASTLDGARRAVINLTSYNYLGLSTHPEVRAAAGTALERYGLGAAGAPVLSGTYDLHLEFARRLADFKGYEDCVLYSGGAAANYGALQGLLRRGDALVLDARAHQSLIDGGHMARARIFFFEHNDPESLDEVLSETEGRRRLVAVEGVYSMDGDLGDLPALLEVCEVHDVPMYVDEAHSAFLFGETGRGVAEHFGVDERIPISMGTMSKALGGVGGFVCASRTLTRYLKAYSTPWIFSCASSPPVVAGCMKALELATRRPELRRRLWANVERFRSQLRGLGLDLGASASQIIPIIIGPRAADLFGIARELQLRGLFLQPVDFPAVPADSRRFRLSVSAQLTHAQIDEACTILDDVIPRRLRPGA